MAYQPRPGTLAEAALKCLRDPGGRMSTADLATRVGCPRESLHASLVPAIKHGLVKRDSGSLGRGNHAFWWLSGHEEPAEFSADAFLSFMDAALHGKPEAFGGIDIDAVHRIAR